MVKKECEKCEFKKNPEKAESRLHINSFLIGSLFTVLTILWTFSSKQVDIILMSQLVLAIPLIFFASLSFSKLGYFENHNLWDTFGWIANNLGYLLFFNAIGLLVALFSYRELAFIYFGLIIVLSSTYYIINIISQPGTLKEHLSKLILWLIVIFVGGVLPIL